MELQSLARLIARLNEIIQTVEGMKMVKLHQRVDQFYYMERVAELQVLYERLAELVEKEKAVCKLVERIVPAVVERWKRDKRWLLQHGDGYEKVNGR